MSMKKKAIVASAVIASLLVAFVAASAWRFSTCHEVLPFAVDVTAMQNLAQLLASLGPPSAVIVTTAGQITGASGSYRRFAPRRADAIMPVDLSVLIVTWRPSCARSNYAVTAIVARDTGRIIDVHTEGTLR